MTVQCAEGVGADAGRVEGSLAMWVRTIVLSLVLGAVHASAHGLHRRLLRQDDHHHASDEFGGGFEQRWGRSLLGSSDDADKLSKGSDTHIAFYVIIPFVSAVVGYVTNVVALQMTFYPLEFTPSQLKFAQLEGQPFGLLGGWQGIIPAKAGKMAAILCDLMTTKLLDVKEMFGKIVPVEFAEALAPEMNPSMSRIIANVMAEEAPTFWNSMPPKVQAGLVKEAMAGAEDFLADVIEDLQNHVYDVLDLKAMVVRLALENKQDVVRMFQEVGESEFRIIEHSGFYFGFAFGIVQMITFYCVDVGAQLLRPVAPGVWIHGGIRDKLVRAEIDLSPHLPHAGVLLHRAGGVPEAPEPGEREVQRAERGALLQREEPLGGDDVRSSAGGVW